MSGFLLIHEDASGRISGEMHEKLSGSGNKGCSHWPWHYRTCDFPVNF